MAEMPPQEKHGWCGSGGNGTEFQTLMGKEERARATLAGGRGDEWAANRRKWLFGRPLDSVKWPREADGGKIRW
jgi:hypothetical protein